MQFDTRSLWIYLHFPTLQLDLIEASLCTPNATGNINENARRVPRAIVDVSTNKLCQLNESALEYGLTKNMGLASASLTCNILKLHEYNSEVESKHIVNIANALYLITSDIVLAPPNAIILRVQNMLNLYGGLKPYWQIVKQTLSRQQVNVCAASSYCIQGAKMLALQQGSRQRPQQASKHACFISDDRELIDAYLQKSPLHLCDIDPQDLQKLARVGVNTYADMLALPVAELANRVSRFSMGIINELQGKQAARVSFYQPKMRYYEYTELIYEISLSASLLPVIGLQINKLSEFLRLRNAHCLAININFYQREHKALNQAFASIKPIYKSEDWLDIIKLKLESIKFLSPVFALSITCEKYEIAEVANDDMFTQKSTHLAALTLLSRLQSKLGEQGVKQLHYVEDFRPQYATQCNTLAELNKPKYKNDYSKSIIFADRPGLLLPVPQILQLNVKVIKGPERIQTGWWDNKPINRDYFIGQCENGQQLWIFKTPNNDWFLHGYFI